MYGAKGTDTFARQLRSAVLTQQQRLSWFWHAQGFKQESKRNCYCLRHTTCRPPQAVSASAAWLLLHAITAGAAWIPAHAYRTAQCCPGRCCLQQAHSCLSSASTPSAQCPECCALRRRPARTWVCCPGSHCCWREHLPASCARGCCFPAGAVPKWHVSACGCVCAFQLPTAFQA